LGGGEGGTAPAIVACVGILEPKPGPMETVDVVENGAAQQPLAFRIDEDGDTTGFENHIAFNRLRRKLHRILVTGTAALDDRQAQARVARMAFLGASREHLLYGKRCEFYDAICHSNSPVRDTHSNTAPSGRNAGMHAQTPDRELSIEAQVRSLAAELGFAACGLTTADDLACGPILGDWLAAGRHGDMAYLAHKHERRLRPSSALPGARSAIVVASTYAAPLPADPGWREGLRGRVAAYAIGADYHDHVAARLETLAARVRELTGAECVAHVDGGPLVEKELARRAGIGWYGRNTNLLRPGLGSSFVLGVLVTTAALEPDRPFESEHCGTCRACIPACPTGALDDGPTIDARLCISYLTIELRGPVPVELRAAIGNWVFGCDVCQQVCPWNGDAPAPDPQANPWLPSWLEMSEPDFRERFGGTALVRPKRRGLARNAAVALGNTANAAAVPYLARALEGHDEPLVRAHAAWALGQLSGSEADAALSRAGSRESVPPVRREIAAAIDASRAR